MTETPDFRHPYQVNPDLSLGRAEDISHEFMPQSCPILAETMNDVYDSFLAEFNRMTLPDQNGHVEVRLSKKARTWVMEMTHQHLKMEMRRQIRWYVTYRFRAAFMAFIRGRFPKPSDSDYRVKEKKTEEA
jgi:hypothetical protein